VWWRGRTNGPLMVLLAHLLTRNQGWRGRTIRLMRVVGSEAARGEVLEHLESLVREARIKARARCVVAADPIEAIRTESARAAVTILGFEPPPEDPEAERRFMEGLDRLTAGLPRVILVDSAGGMALEG